MSNFWREIQNGLSDCKYWGISKKILRKEYFKDGIEYKNFIQLLSFVSIIYLNLHSFSPFLKSFLRRKM